MNRWLLSFICGLLITVVLTMVAFSDGTSNTTTRTLLWQASLIANFIPHGNIGTPENPIHEGSMLDFLPAFVGIPLGVPIYTLLTYAVLWLIAKARHQSKSKANPF